MDDFNSPLIFFDTVKVVRYLLEEANREINVNPCKVKGCRKTDDEKPMAFRGEDYCSDLHRKVLAGELTLKVEHVVVVATDTPKEVVE